MRMITLGAAAAVIATSTFNLEVAMAVEEASYEVLESDGDFELRRYAPQIVAETLVEGDFKDVGNEGFRRLSGYIFGKNRKQQSVSMTAPVSQEPVSQKIAMTAPVNQESVAGAWPIFNMLPYNILHFQWVAIFLWLLWHYTVVGWSSDDRFHDGARSVRNAESIIDHLLAGLGSRGFADVQHLRVGAFELHRHPVLPPECPAQAFPTEVNAAGLELIANRVHEVIGQDRNKQMATHAMGFVMKDRP